MEGAGKGLLADFDDFIDSFWLQVEHADVEEFAVLTGL